MEQIAAVGEKLIQAIYNSDLESASTPLEVTVDGVECRYTMSLTLNGASGPGV